MIKGVDLSNNNVWSKARDAIMDSEHEFVWLKVTEGRTYFDPDFNAYAEMVRSEGKILGAYHFARPDNNSPYEEAEWFVENIKPYLSEGMMLALDWEKGIKGAPYDWIAQWMGNVQNLLVSDNMPCIYLSFSNYQEWKGYIPEGCGIWIAYWDRATSEVIKMVDRLLAFHQIGIVGGVDRDVFNGDIEQCRKYMFFSPADKSADIINWDELRNGKVRYMLGRNTEFKTGWNIFIYEGRRYQCWIRQIDIIESYTDIFQIITLEDIMPYGTDDNR